MHNIYSYHAKFNPTIPKNLIEKYSSEGDLILDPFCGSGTTLLEAIKLNRRSIGVDINPIGILSSRVKTSSYSKNEILFYLDKILSEEYGEVNTLPSFPDREFWFNEKTLNDLGQIHSRILEITEIRIRDYFYLVLLSILNNCSRRRATWNLGYIADNVMPNKDNFIDVRDVFISKVRKNLENSLPVITELNKSLCFEMDIMDFECHGINTIVTSPPYPFAVDFIKYNRLALYWMEKPVDELSKREVGARNKRNRAESLDLFFTEMERIYLHIMEMVVDEGYWCMTIGNTSRDKKKIYFVEWTIDLFQKYNWVLIENEIRDLKNQTMAQKRIPQEHVLVFKKLSSR
jgi:SAM-dependent methyltransferase